MLQKSIILESNSYIEKLNIYIIVILNYVRKGWKPTNIAACDAVNDLSTRKNKNGATDTLNRKRKPWKTKSTIRKYDAQK